MFKRYYKRVFIAMSAQALAQLNGINVISYYAPLVFESAGWMGRSAILMTGINALTYLAATVPPWYLVDKWGRRFILLSGAVAMIISLSAISYFIYIDVRFTPSMVVIFVMIYNASFGASWVRSLPLHFTSSVFAYSVSWEKGTYTMAIPSRDPTIEHQIQGCESKYGCQLGLQLACGRIDANTPRVDQMASVSGTCIFLRR